LFFEAGILFSRLIRQLIGTRRIAASHSNLIRIANQIRSRLKKWKDARKRPVSGILFLSSLPLSRLNWFEYHTL
jgi:hypothetical protein